MSHKFISIAAFTNAADAAIARGLLEQKGLRCHSFEERLSPRSPHYKGVNGRSMVQVERKNLLKAMKILKEKGHLHSEDFCVSRWDLLMARFFARSRT